MDQPRWLSKDEQSAWRGFLAMSRQLDAVLQRDMQRGSDISIADFGVLVSLTDTADGRIRYSDLARALAWEKSRLSHHVARMQKRGLVTREGVEDDGRGALVVITAKGRAAIERAAPRHVATVRELVFDQITPEQVEQLRSISNAVLNRLADECD